ncbi:MAG: SUMF1/EgtB/PvdO family nonheme iron enzyme [Phycisphaerae bacterium]|nr:SUMF1/EgtB/PvdO family nonheme iron enzyme [Phycisphaerae bacterium]
MRADTSTSDYPSNTRNYMGFRIARSEPYLNPVLTPDAAETRTFTGPYYGPFTPQSFSYTLTNRCWKTLTIDVTSDASWLLIDGQPAAAIVLDAFAVATVEVTLGEEAYELLQSPSEPATLTFDETTTGSFLETRTVGLDITGSLLVEPEEPHEPEGPQGGPFTPASAIYTVVNDQPGFLICSVTTNLDPLESWLLINGQIELTGGNALLISPGFEESVTITLNAAVVSVLAPGTYTASILFHDDVTGNTAVREATLTVHDAPLTLNMAIVPADDAQPSGPSYTFRIARREITNAEFAAFLNSAIREANRATPLGSYMYHDTDSGCVYINPNGAAGEVGTAGSGTMLFDAGDTAAISFDAGAYVVQTGKEDFPVAGVSWYGAAKFCNWLTVVQGGDPDQQAYTEGTTAADWRPVVISAADWATRDLNTAERQTLVSTIGGYRLPMDDQATAASAYNEWYKAAAWTGTANATYGFGRNTLTGADANYQNSGDPYDNGPTPAGYYDGTKHGSFQTADTVNRYGLYDASGNVSEWVQDWSGGSAYRGTRGGHWSNTQAAALANTAIAPDAASATRSWTGFRVVQAGPRIPVAVSCDTSDCVYAAAGPAGGPFAEPSYAILLDNSTGVPVEWSAAVDQSWLTIDGEAETSGVVGSGGDRTLTLTPAEAADDLLPPASPYIPMTTVPAAEAQPSGPRYSFRMGTFEVTNADYLAFLNSALANLTGPRGQYLYHDIDDSRVYVNASGANGQVGTQGAGTLVFDGNVAGAIQYDSDATQYVLTDERGDHPVVGVSWYGAVKYCNWLTIQSGLPSDQRAYVEGTVAANWRPTVVDSTNWAARDLTDEERQDLVDNCAGYRLPMDDGSAHASAFNEWYKAAAWNGGANSVYGFGRSSLSPADANYESSGDPFDNGTTPTGYYDGSTHDTFVTENSNNGFYDLTGNVREWIQDHGTAPGNRAIRGGCWNDTSASTVLKADVRQAQFPEQVDPFTGFRVVQGRLDCVAEITIEDITTGDTFTHPTRLLITEPVTFAPADGIVATGWYGGPFEPTTSIVYNITSTSRRSMSWRVSSSQSWATVNGASSQAGSVTPETPAGVTIALAAAAATLAPGMHTATITLENTTTGYQETRRIELTIREPLEVTPTDGLSFSLLYQDETLPPSQDYTVTNLRTAPIQYAVTSNKTWISLNGAASIPSTALNSGPENSQAVAVSINTGALSLAVGSHTATLTFQDVTSGRQEARTVTLIVDDPLRLTPAEAFFASGEYGGEITPLTKTYSIENRFDYPIDWTATRNANWLLVNGLATASGTALPGVPQTLSVEIDATAAGALTEGTYEAVVSLTDHDTLGVQTRSATLTIGPHIAIEPATGLEAYRAPDGTLTPLEQIYTITNYDTNANEYAVQMGPGCTWIWLNYGLGASGTLEPYESAQVRVTIDDAQASLFEADQTCEVDFLNLTTGKGNSTLTMAVRLPSPPPVLDPPALATVPKAQNQPAGPQYDYRIGIYEITNAQFAVFLNNALANLDNERGQYLYHDTDSGNVYIHSAQTGTTGTAGTGTLIFNAAANGRIAYSGGEYVLSDSAFADHPVAGVSWYGALKFCNWLTLDQGFGPLQRCYGEGTSASLSTWRPLTITPASWAARFMNDAERAALVADYRGYRLPMDNNALQADDYNEWFKAAAWRQDLYQNMTYGFGRNTATLADANWNASGDPFEPGTTPVGYYNGTTYDLFATNDTANAYGLYDLCGNLFEWMQDQYALTSRAVRGGSWAWGDASGPGMTNSERKYATPQSGLNTLGFRVVRTPGTIVRAGDANGDGSIDLADYASFATCLSGPDPQTPPSGCDAVDFNVNGAVDLADFSVFQRRLGAGE